MAAPIGGEANLLRGRVDELMDAGGTEDGRAWCIKALHPAEPSIENVAIPDGSPTDTVRLSLNYSTTVSLPTAVANWDCNVTLLPHPTFPLCIDTVGMGGTVSNFRVPLFAGTSADKDLNVLMAQFSAWRLTYLSVTGHLDANATTDSGSIVAAQFPLRPTAILFGGRAAEGYFHMVPVTIFDNCPSYDEVMQMPRSYQNNLRAGFYMPLKLSNTTQHWRNGSESMGITDKNYTVDNAAKLNIHLANAVTTPWPFPSITSSTIDAGVMSGAATASLLNDYSGIICMKNVAPTSSIVLKLKMGLECRVRPYSADTPFLRPPAPYDALALQQYYGVVAQLADCYPAEWNSHGKLLGAIARGLKAISAPLAAIPGYGVALGPLSSGLGSLAKWGADAMKEGGGKKKRKRKPKQKATTTNARPRPPPKPKHLQVVPKSPRV